MYRHPLLRGWLLLVPVLVAACAQPQAVAPPTMTPPTPATPAAVAAAPATAAPAVQTIAPPTDTPNGATSVVPQAQIDLTQVAAPPSMPAVPLDQALQQFNGHALLYTRPPGYLMIGDPDSGASLWLNGAFCPSQNTRDVYGEWSADGQFVAFACQDDSYKAAIHLLDMRTANGRQIAQGDAVDFAWSPTGHRLLVAEQTDTQRAFILDAATDATTVLPVAPLWENHGPPPATVGSAMLNGGWSIDANRAAMAWSPDGAKIVMITNQTYVIDADAAHMRAGEAPLLASFGTSSSIHPRWSHNGRFLYTVEDRQNHNDPLAPSSQWGAVEVRTEISTGVVTDTYPAEPLWSPDEQAYLTRVPTARGDGNWALYQADGTLTRVLTDEVTYGPFWTPDSHQVLLQPSRGEANLIVVIDLAGHRHTILTTHDKVRFLGRSSSPISPDGGLVAFTVELSYVLSDERVVVYDFQGQQRAIFAGWKVMGWRAAQ